MSVNVAKRTREAREEILEMSLKIRETRRGCHRKSLAAAGRRGAKGFLVESTIRTDGVVRAAFRATIGQSRAICKDRDAGT